MKQFSGQQPIPLGQRIQPARLYAKGIAALELELEKGLWAKWARVDSKDLPDGRTLDDYSEGDRIEVFLLHPSDDPGYYHASIWLADRRLNPWFVKPPKKGDLVDAEAIQYLANNKGVFVRLADSGIDALLRISEVPGGGEDIRDLIDIGDKLAVEIKDVRSDLLEVSVSVIGALKTLGARERRLRLDDELETVRSSLKESWAQPRRKGVFVGVLSPDNYFSIHLVQWLEAFGVPALRLADVAHLERILDAVNHPTHILCAKELWPPYTLGKPSALQLALAGKGVRVIWLHSAVSPTLPPFSSVTLALPLYLDELLRAIDDPGFRPPVHRQNDTELHVEYQSREVQRIADRFLSEVCERLGFNAALWVVREREGVYIPRAWHNLADSIVHGLQPRLAQTLIKDSIETASVFVWPFGKIGPLRLLIQDDSNRVLCVPVRFCPLDTNAPEVSRAVAFFYNVRVYPYEPENPRDHPAVKALDPYLLTMGALVHTLYFARHNETLSAFANLGRNAASYLHELGQKALPVQDFLDHLREAPVVSPEEWRRLRRQLAELVEMARGDLGRIRRQHDDRMQLRERLTRLAQLYSFRFNTADCAFSVELPDLPLLLNCNPLVIDQVVSNLLDNALYFAGKRPGFGRVSVRVRLDPEGDKDRPLVIEVEDNGSGVRAGMGSMLFEPRHSGREEGTGTGMGLFIARGFVQGLRGDLRLVESVRWRCTRFEVRLPIRLNQGGRK